MKPEVPPTPESTVGVIAEPPALPARRSVSVFRRRLRKFRTLKRGYYAFLLLTAAYAISFALPLLINNKALIVHYNGSYYFPIRQYYPASEFGMEALGEPNYRALKLKLAEEKKGDWVLMPL